MKVKIKFEDIVITLAYFQMLLLYKTIGDEIFDTGLIATVIFTAWYAAKKFKRYIHKKETMEKLISEIKGIQQVVEVNLHELDKKYESSS